MEKKRNYVTSIYRFIIHIKTEDIYSGISKDVETRSDTSNYEFDVPLPKGKKQKSNWKD